jgi:hypothetical protein
MVAKCAPGGAVGPVQTFCLGGKNALWQKKKEKEDPDA